MRVEPLAPRFQYEVTPEGARATIPARRNWFFLLFMSLWLVGWAFGEFGAAHQLVSNDSASLEPKAFLIVWLAFWTLGGAAVFAVIAWQLFGREVISVNSANLEHRVEALGIGRTRSFGKADVKDLRAVSAPALPFGSQIAWVPPLFAANIGSVVFDYGARTFRFAPSLDEAEARMLVSKLSALLPRNLV